MAVTNLPHVSVSGVYTPRDFTQQLNYMNENAAKALRSAGDFVLDLQNEAVKQKQKKLIEDEYNRQQTLKENIANDERLLVKLKNDLAELKSGKEVQMRSGEQMMPQNLTPTMQSAMDALKKTDENKSFWNFKPAEVSNG